MLQKKQKNYNNTLFCKWKFIIVQNQSVSMAPTGYQRPSIINFHRPLSFSISFKNLLHSSRCSSLIVATHVSLYLILPCLPWISYHGISLIIVLYTFNNYFNLSYLILISINPLLGSWSYMINLIIIILGFLRIIKEKSVR